MLVMLQRRGIRPDLIMFADTGGEFPEVYDYVRRIDAWLDSWRAPLVTWVKRKPSLRVRYRTLEGNCLDNETLPTLAFGGHSCSLKWKVDLSAESTMKTVAPGYSIRPKGIPWRAAQGGPGPPFASGRPAAVSSPCIQEHGVKASLRRQEPDPTRPLPEGLFAGPDGRA